MDFDIDALTQKINRIKTSISQLDVEDNIKKYGTFLDSRKISSNYMYYLYFSVSIVILFR